jgi:hypothetical protein
VVRCLRPALRPSPGLTHSVNRLGLASKLGGPAVGPVSILSPRATTLSAPSGSGGRLPVRLMVARVNSRMACWPFVMLYKLHIGG